MHGKGKVKLIPCSAQGREQCLPLAHTLVHVCLPVNSLSDVEMGSDDDPQSIIQRLEKTVAWDWAPGDPLYPQKRTNPKSASIAQSLELRTHWFMDPDGWVHLQALPLTACLWDNYLTSLHLSFHICDYQ